VIFHPSGDEILSASDAQKWDRWKIAEAAHVRDTHLGGEVFQLAAAGEFFVAPSANGRVHLFKAQDGEKVREYQPEGSARFVSRPRAPPPTSSPPARPTAVSSSGSSRRPSGWRNSL